jgi:hypothetical protein
MPKSNRPENAGQILAAGRATADAQGHLSSSHALLTRTAIRTIDRTLGITSSTLPEAVTRQHPSTPQSTGLIAPIGVRTARARCD